MEGKRKIKVIYLGGFFMAEYSLLHSFLENESEIYFPIDPHGHFDYYNDYYLNNHSQQKYVLQLTRQQLEIFIDDFRPDVIIHRYYKGHPVMHPYSYEIAQKSGIPLIRYEMETDEADVTSCKGNNYDALIYAHDTDYFLQKAKASDKPFYFYPYGVSGFERMTDAPKIKNLGALGFRRSNIPERELSILEFVISLSKIGERLNVYGGVMDWIAFKLSSELIINEKYNLEQTTDIINQHKLIVNFESLPYLNGAYSHKMFQALGCGVPVITRYKKSIEDLFGGHVLMFDEMDKIGPMAERVMVDDKYRKRHALSTYKFIHEYFDWYKRLHLILKEMGIV